MLVLKDSRAYEVRKEVSSSAQGCVDEIDRRGFNFECAK
jgi:hypothetical protein